MFVRKKSKGSGSAYYQLVESRRVDGKPRQRVILHLESDATVDDAIEEWPKKISWLRRRGYEKEAGELKAKLDRLKELRPDGEV